MCFLFLRILSHAAPTMQAEVEMQKKRPEAAAQLVRAGKKGAVGGSRGMGRQRLQRHTRLSFILVPLFSLTLQLRG